MTDKRIIQVILLTGLVCGVVPAAPPSPESVMYASPGPYPHGITSDGTNLWVTDYSTTNAYCIDPATGTVLHDFKLDIGNRSPRGLAWDGEHLWVATKSRLFEVDPVTATNITEFSGLDSGQQGVAFDGTNLWVVSTNAMAISCIDPSDGTVLRQHASPASSPRGVEYHDGRLWHADSYQDRVFEMDPDTGAVLSSFLVSRSGPRGIAWHDDRFWLIDKDSMGIVGFPRTCQGHNTRTTAYVSQGTVTCAFTNTTGSTFVDTHVYTALGTSDNATDVLSRRFFVNGIETAPTGLSTDAFGQVSADLDLGNVTPGTGIAVEIAYTARLHNWTVNVDTNLVGALASVDTNILALYTRDEEMYNITHPDIGTHAAAAVGSETNVFAMARLIHDHVINELNYDSNSSWEQAVTVLNNGVASCSGYAFTMIALCRNRGIPARFAGGSECRSFETGRTDTLHHRWVEVYVPTYGWVPFDPTHDEWDPADPDARWREVGAQQRALVLRRGGGTNEMGWGYTSLARHAGGQIDAERAVVWTGLPWTDGGDFDGDGVTNAADAFAYDHAASVDTDGDGMPDDWNPGYTNYHSTSVPPLLADNNDDNDALTDDEEAIAGTDPADANSTLAIQGLALDGASLCLQWPSVDGRVYAVWTNAAAAATAACESAGITATPPLNTYTTDVPVTPRFYRIHVAEAP